LCFHLSSPGRKEEANRRRDCQSGGKCGSEAARGQSDLTIRCRNHPQRRMLKTAKGQSTGPDLLQAFEVRTPQVAMARWPVGRPLPGRPVVTRVWVLALARAHLPSSIPARKVLTERCGPSHLLPTYAFLQSSSLLGRQTLGFSPEPLRVEFQPPRTCMTSRWVMRLSFFLPLSLNDKPEEACALQLSNPQAAEQRVMRGSNTPFHRLPKKKIRDEARVQATPSRV